jgi:hypothetical protein
MIKQGKTPQGDKIARKEKRGEVEQYVSEQESDVGGSKGQSEKVGEM